MDRNVSNKEEICVLEIKLEFLEILVGANKEHIPCVECAPPISTILSIISSILLSNAILASVSISSIEIVNGFTLLAALSNDVSCISK